MRYFLSLLLCITILDVTAQKRKAFKVNPGQKVTEAIPSAEIYTYPEFSDGTVYLRNQTYSPAKLNYNSLFEEMQFIDAKGDTVSLADEATIRFIAIKNDTFYFDKIFVKQIASYGTIKLAERQYFAMINHQRIGGFGDVNDGSSVTTFNSMNSSTSFKDLVAKDLFTLGKNTTLYIGDEFNHFKEANKKNVLESFSKNEAEVKKYLKENKVDFSNKNDLQKMLSFVTSSAPTKQ